MSRDGILVSNRSFLLVGKGGELSSLLGKFNNVPLVVLNRAIENGIGQSNDLELIKKSVDDKKVSRHTAQHRTHFL